MIDTSIYFLLSIIILFLILLGSLSVSLFVQRGLEMKRQEKIATFLKTTEQDWFSYLIEGDKEAISYIIPKEKLDYKAAELVLLTYKQNIYSEYTMERICVYAKEYLQSMYQKQLQSMKWSIRMNGLYRVRDFRLEGLREEVLRLLNSNQLTKEEYLQICKILPQFTGDEWSKQLKEPKFPLGEYAYQKIINELDEMQVNSLIEEIHQLPNNLQYTLLNWIGKNYRLEQHELLEELSQSKNSELRLRALKAMNEIGYIPDQNKIKQLVESAIWEERLMAAKLLLYVQGDKAIVWLSYLLEDSSWWVRKESATSIINRENGIQTLQRIIQHSEDSFAIDTGIEMLGGVKQVEYSS